MKKIGNTSFTKEGYEKFKELPKNEQISYISDRLSPKDPQRASTLLGYGNISSGVASEVGKDKPNDTSSKGNGNGGTGSKSSAKESKD